MEERPTWSPGECAWAIAQRDEDLKRWCSAWNRVCEPKKCERKKWAARERARLLRAYRDFPGNPFQVKTKARAAAARTAGVDDWWTAALPKGHCRWCGDPIWSDKDPTRLNLRRTWHSACLHRYYLHTRADTQLPFLIERDGPGCAGCGDPVGRWAKHVHWQTGDPIVLTPEMKDNYWVKRVGAVEGPISSVYWVSGLQVDHVIALAVVALTIEKSKRWRFFGPGNIQGLCHPCHVLKTKADVLAMKAARITLPLQVPAQPAQDPGA